MHILYLEDEPNDARLVERFVKATPHKMTLASTVQDATEALELGTDLILVDVLLGQSREGYDFVRDLRRKGYTQPVVAITGLSLPQEVEECYRAGCNEVITKPYMINELAETIGRYA